jgi:hypothetical protein
VAAIAEFCAVLVHADGVQAKIIRCCSALSALTLISKNFCMIDGIPLSISAAPRMNSFVCVASAVPGAIVVHGLGGVVRRTQAASTL